MNIRIAGEWDAQRVERNRDAQTVGLLAMEPPVGPGVEELRDGKERVFAAMQTLKPDDLVRGQYEGYRDEDGVAPESDVETFAAVRCYVDSWRWADVPIYLRAGKNLPITATEVRVELHRPPTNVFAEYEHRAYDANYFRNLMRAASGDLLAAYSAVSPDYPPVTVLTFALTGALTRGMSPIVAAKLPEILAGAVLAVTIGVVVQRRGAPAWVAALAAAAYFLNPAVVYVSAFWTQAEALCRWRDRRQ